MTRLPASFPSDKLRIIERLQLEWFYTRYTEEFYSDYLFGHFMMAAYASVPACLTPDLLYKMWQNFGEYQWGGKPEFIHPVAVSDVLLAPFCQEVSYELFRMEENTRLSFLKWMSSDDPLWVNRKPHSLITIADFIENYHDRPNNTVIREGAKYREDQLMEVKVYQDPEEVADYYLQKLSKAKDDDNEQEILAIITALDKATKKEEYTAYSDKKTFTGLFQENELNLWKHAIQQNNNTFASLLEETGRHRTEGSPLLLRKEDHSRTIQISHTETKLVTKLDALVESRNYAVIIGCSEKDYFNCQRFRETLEKLASEKKWELQSFTTSLGKEYLSKKLEEALKPVTPADTVMVYISASQSVLLPSGNCQVNYFGSVITDAAFNKIFSAISPSSFTLVVQCSYAATPFWMDTNKAGYAFFAASSGHLNTDTAPPSRFTASFCEVLSLHGGKISNRQLYIKTIVKQGDLTDRSNSPKFLSNRETYYRQFASGNVQRTRIQHTLRLCGYLQKTEVPEWDADVETAYQKFLEDLKLSTGLTEAGTALDGKIQSNKQEQKPVLLFVFSDPEGKLPAIAREIHTIKSVLRNSKINEYNEIKIIQNKPLKEVTDFIKNTSSRNRVQLFYYSGFDREGYPTFTDGEINLALWSEWLSFQDTMELVVLNTCRSGFVADHLAQIGVGMSIGNDQQFTDEEGAAFGSQLIEIIAKRDKLSGLPIQQNAI